MTSMPAQRLRLSDKGRLSAGADADIVIFDAQNICDKATFENPELAPEGIDRVIIGGKTAVISGQIVNAALGKSIRRK